ncbi:cyclic nucleotide-binding domain protein [Ichthyophthirius multifiliis]|uniref:Cyclic nucleotide-binding domain protein n=1 Tax=Ichthyophthirius multifiliis TaxID=5932 RepID=G0QR19_ICHMU|nr:cyclic nucleotide-binding domain protein [Ichthyophthirius multifiliis]EGR32337.1 cyclic nucleotide-binding domain protein [Ichthyophthirius multifiliis]|eukprot:XP_004035823.1 cyclic nucleotide-binding domain protein [Ichthyophthirius multifiliis]
MKLTQNIKFFKDLIQQQNGCTEIHKQCCQSIVYEHHPKGTEVITIDTEGTKFYIIFNGSVQVHIRKGVEQLKQVAIMPTGSSFGELALISNQPRLATIICEEDCDFLVLKKKDFNRIMKNIELKVLNDKVACLIDIPFIGIINKQFIRDIYSKLKQIDFFKGQVVYQEGDKAQYVYIVIKGHFVAYKNFKIQQQDQWSLQIDENQKIYQKQYVKKMKFQSFTDKQFFGEDELLFRDDEIESKRKWTVVCENAEKSTLFAIKKKYFISKIMGDINGKKWMLQYLKNKKKYEEEKIKSLQNQVNKFWKYLKEDRKQLIMENKRNDFQRSLYNISFEEKIKNSNVSKEKFQYNLRTYIQQLKLELFFTLEQFRS